MRRAFNVVTAHIHYVFANIKAHSHLYANTNKACGTERMPTNAKKLVVQCPSHKRMSKRSAGYSLPAQMNVCPHQYDCERIFLWSTDSRWIVFAKHTPHKRMKANAVRLHVHIMCFVCVFVFILRLHTDVDAALDTSWWGDVRRLTKNFCWA